MQKHARDNRSRQLNPEHPAYRKSRGHSTTPPKPGPAQRPTKK